MPKFRQKNKKKKKSFAMFVESHIHTKNQKIDQPTLKNLFRRTNGWTESIS